MTTKPAAPRLDGSGHCARYQGVKVYGRGQGVRAAFVSPNEVSPEQRGWIPHGFVDGVFTHHNFPEHAVVERGGREWLVLQRCERRPNLAFLLEAAQDALGPDLTCGRTDAFPRALRVPLTVAGGGAGAAAKLPLEPIRCRRIGDACHIRVLGVDVELRVSATNAPPKPPQYYAEAFVRRHETYEGEARSLLFLADVRHLHQAEDPARLVKFATGVLDALFAWIDDLASIGLVPSSKPKCALPVIATAHHMTEVDDVLFDLKLPSVERTQRFVTHWAGWSRSVRTRADVRDTLRLLAVEPTALGRAFADTQSTELASQQRVGVDDGTRAGSARSVIEDTTTPNTGASW
jgi:hypothetical protein